jgi:hypothetical protein
LNLEDKLVNEFEGKYGKKWNSIEYKMNDMILVKYMI